LKVRLEIEAQLRLLVQDGQAVDGDAAGDRSVPFPAGAEAGKAVARNVDDLAPALEAVGLDLGKGGAHGAAQARAAGQQAFGSRHGGGEEIHVGRTAQMRPFDRHALHAPPRPLQDGDSQPRHAQAGDGFPHRRVPEGFGNPASLQIVLFGAHAGRAVQGQNQLQGHRLGLLRVSGTHDCRDGDSDGANETPPRPVGHRVLDPRHG